MRRRADHQAHIRKNMWEALEREEARKDDKRQVSPPEVDDFGFHHPFDFVEQAAQLLEISNWVCWPDPGGWANQDAYLVEDIWTYFNLKARLRYEVESRFDSPEVREVAVRGPSDEIVRKKLG